MTLFSQPPSLPAQVSPPASSTLPAPFSPPEVLAVRPHWTWTTSKGKVYHNVVITKVEADCVTILDDEGGALVKISLLPAEIQALLNYNPELAAAAAVQRAKNDRANQIAMDNESILASNMALAKWQNTELADNQILAQTSAANAKAAAIARAQAAAAALNTYQDDMAFVNKHVYVDPKTEVVSGSPYYLQRYNEDTQAMSQLQPAATAP